jgi:hypothetical protein
MKVSRSNNDLRQLVLLAWNNLSRYHSTFMLREVQVQYTYHHCQHPCMQNFVTHQRVPE